ncbi:tripartite tricarboxylate transporter substrate binding protein [Cupriavidus metallidurans]|uniref:Bug family tripartite tricarboxylate transporter substrate binding protein n=1 Tax=Cupriavidus TaxID=106589 RepID=UPI0002A21C26|nr:MULTISPECIES: tripartite tricarboxylate transporter substrate binding protein [Cupriavidus]EKZ99396.1 extra-cytoplasmic solute receptor family protein 119 [Cupriavidus sp. HMR-1]GMG90027.1 hypothetical protein Cmtc_12470 [Cupriavidus sp. TKC]
MLEMIKIKHALIVIALAAAGAVGAENYPSAPITLIVPFAAGGPTDVIARVIAKGMQDQLRQSVVIDNKSGAGGRTGIGMLKRARPDGYTIGMATASTQGVAPNVYAKLEYDPLKDFKSVGQIVIAPGVLVASKGLVPDCKMSTFLSLLRTSPRKYTYGSAGQGSLSHLSGERFLAVTGLHMLHVPYRGLGPAMNDLYGGQIAAVFDNVSTAMPHIQSGKLCALAVQAKQRLSPLPDVPTYGELGLADLNTPTWYGILTPRNTPDPIVFKLNAALNAALKTNEIKDAFDRLGVLPSATSPAEFNDIQKREFDMWRDIVTKTNMKKLDD